MKVARMQDVLVATDFSEGSEAAVERALKLPFHGEPTLHVVHVVTEDIPRKLEEEVHGRARGALDELVAKISRAVKQRAGPPFNIIPSVLRGQPYVELVRYARTMDIDLIVIGRHGRRGFRDLFIGSTAERVVRKGDTPILLVHRQASKPYLRPMAAIDLTDTSGKVLELSLSLLDARAKAVTLFHAYDLPFAGTLARTSSRRAVAEYRKECKRAARAEANRFAAALGKLHLQLKVVVRAGDPRTAIVEELVRRRSDLLAVGTHARSGISHALLGSVAEWVIRSAPCDVAITRPTRFTFELP